MKTLILYATKHGATRRLAQEIAGRIPGAVPCDFLSDAVPLLSNFGCVVLGSRLTAGSINPKLRDFIRKNAAELCGKKLGLFLSGMDGRDAPAYFLKNFPAEVLDAASSRHFLGGVYSPDKCSAPERWIMKKVAGLTGYASSLDYDKIDLLVRELAA